MTKRSQKLARVPVLCEWCGKKFWGQRQTARFCGDACKQANYRVRRDAQKASEKMTAFMFDDSTIQKRW